MKDVQTTQLIAALKNDITDIIHFDEYEMAREVLVYLKDNFDGIKTELSSEERGELFKILTILRWIALPSLKDTEVLSLFNEHLGYVFDLENYDLDKKFKVLLLGFPWEPDRDLFKQKLKSILDVNQLILTKKGLDEYDKPTVENWIKYYTSKFGVGEVSNVDLQQFYVKDKAVINLEQKDRERVIKFFNFYEKLKYSSVSAKGYEGEFFIDSEDFKGQLIDGRMEKEDRLDPRRERILRVVRGEKVYGGLDNKVGMPLTAGEKEIEDLKKEARQFQDGSIEQLAIEEEIEKLKHIEDLKAEQNKYKEGSLEWNALAEEIRHLENEEEKEGFDFVV